MSYAERVSSQPRCYGDEREYDPGDDTCDDCQWQDSCRDEVRRKKGLYGIRPTVSYSPPYRSPYVGPRTETRSEPETPSWSPGPMSEKDDPLKRFLKDGIAGALRGLFFEFYRFWKTHRLR